MANKGQRMIFEDEYQYLKDLKEEHPDPSAEWGGGSGDVNIEAGTGITITTESDDTKTISVDDTVAMKTDIPTYTEGTGIDITGSTISVVVSDVVTAGNITTALGYTPSYFNGNYENLTNKPDLSIYAESADLATVATTGDYDDLIDKPDLSIYAQSANLATVATSGSYNDLIDKPTIPTLTSQLGNDTGYITLLDLPTTLVTTNTDQTIDCNKTFVRRYTPQSAAQYQYKFASPKSSIASGIWEYIVPNRLYNSRNSYYAAANSEGIVDIKDLVPANTSDLINDSGFITGITSSDVTTALGYTPTNPSSLATVATTGDYYDLLDRPDLSIYAESADLGNCAYLNQSSLIINYSQLTNTPSIPTTATSTVTPTTTQLVFTYQDNTTETITLMTGASVTTTLS